MIGRTLSPLVFSSEWGRQMRMILGPRQVGRTTLAKDQLRREKPVLLVESKVSDAAIESHHLATAGVLGKILVIQVCARQGILSMETRNAFRVSADRLFAS
jgi:hypothetical protein